jgi:NAD(P)-dependent dehydrogenase (short-subunit alcohol dehydrogenase family)
MKDSISSRSMARPLEVEVALVTGGGRGFGRAIAEALAGAGAKVAIVSRTAAQVEAAAAAIREAGGEALGLPCDVTDRGQAEAAVAAVAARFGPVTILVNNAGTPGPFGPIAETDPDDWWRALTLHLYAPLLFAHAVLPGMLARGGGRIINVASRAAIMFQPGLSAYVVGKTAQVQWAAHLDAETREAGVRVFAIQPGDAPTEFAHATLRDDGAQKHLGGMLGVLGEWVATIDPAPVLAKCGARVVELASGDWDGLAGRYLDVDWDWAETLAAGDVPVTPVAPPGS